MTKKVEEFEVHEPIKVRQKPTDEWIVRKFVWEHEGKVYCPHLTCPNKLTGWNFAEKL